MLLLFGQGCGQPMQQMREGLMHGVYVDPSRFAGRVIRVSREDTLEKTYLSVCIHLPVLCRCRFRAVVRIRSRR